MISMHHVKWGNDFAVNSRGGHIHISVTRTVAQLSFLFLLAEVGTG